MIVTLTQEEADSIKSLATAVKEARSDYNDARNDNGPARNSQYILGFLCEYAVGKHFGMSIDMGVYQAGRVISKLDIGSNVEVKACRTALVGSQYHSWVMSKSSRLIHSPCEDEYIVLTEAGPGDLSVVIRGWVKAAEVQAKWKPTLKIADKKALYYSDIKEVIRPINTLTREMIK